MAVPAMIIATAGHVDHGKTSLLKRLTGIDTDRLPEEKRRGLTIDLGFAYTDALRPGETTGFVDVPGHEKFIRNMLAGVTAIDAALLVVAADDGPMPQTREHLAILDLVGVRTGIVAITKTDLVEADWLVEVIAETRALLEPTGLAEAPVVAVSSTTGAGFDRLAEAIGTLRAVEKPACGGFRMAIDRSFIVGGAGLVVTGLVQSGILKAGDRLAVSPAGPKGIGVRVRGLKVQDAPAAEARAGDRCAVNLAGADVDRAAIGRGQWLVAPVLRSVSRRLDIDLRLLASEARPLRHWTSVHVHAGTADIPGRVALLEAGKLAPGERALAQLVLDRGICVCRGDAVILRDQSAKRTIGGGMVLDCDGPQRGRGTPQRLALVRAQRRPKHAEALAAQLEVANGGVDLRAFARNRNLIETELAGLEAPGLVPGLVRAGGGGGQAAILDRHLAGLAEAIRSSLAGRTEGRNSVSGLPAAALPRMLPGRPLAACVDAALDRLMRDGTVERRGERIVLAGRRVELEPRDASLWARIEPALTASGRPRTVWEVSEALGIVQSEAARFFKRAQAAGLVMQVSKNRFLTPETLESLANAAETGLASSGGDRFTVADFRDWSGLGRNLSVEMLEYFDRAGFTRRAGNERVIRRPAAETFGTAARG
ncbi:MAG: selenocysteine-specific translation elongation factor [Rhodospirillaceae bacterium]|nr:selenocysteine-specific translation elongation factor [Rhodospirillaceae bacterium]MDE0616158.1 selenocysteine-specific translation elongation factor [Rhodospirillaceae bacterium]